LTTLDFGDLYAFHMRSSAVLTIGVQQRELAVDLGVLDVSDGHVHAMREKPRIPLHVSTGIYVVSPEVRRDLREGEPVDMSDLIGDLIERGQPVCAYAFSGEWHDIGTLASLEEARVLLPANQ